MSEIPTGDWSRVDDAAMRFERAWKDGFRPRIEDYLIKGDEPQRARLLDELLKVEIELRRRAGDQPTPQEYRERFPAHATVVAAVFSGGQTPQSGPTGAGLSGNVAPRNQNLDRSLIRGVLAGLAETGGSVRRVLLRDTEPEPESPVVRPSSPEIPRESGRYQLLGEIGHGGMGAVLKGRDPDLGRDLAVKILLEEHQHDPELVQRFIEEAQIGGQLQHPGIVPVYELGEFADGRPYFTMKLIKGRTLAALLKERANPAHDLPRFLGVFDQVCQAMAYAHARGVIHRDLKPSNIMVGAFGEVQVMDWGLAKVLPHGGTADEPLPHSEMLDVSVIRTVRSGSDADASRPGSVLGTPAYMAPEQAGGVLELIDERADVFGLGSILCEILTGDPAYAGPSFAAILRKARIGDAADALKRLDDCGADGELKALACRCLATEPAERPRDAGMLAAAITAHLTSVQERLRQAELDRVEAQARVEEETKRRILADDLANEAKARAAEERKRRRVTVALAASILALAGLGGGTWLAAERSNSERRASVAQVIGEARQKQKAAREAPADVPALWSEALAAVERAEGLLLQGGEPGQKREIAALRASITTERDLAQAESEWSAQLADIRSTKAESLDGAAPDQSYAFIFRAAGIDPDVLSAAQVGARIRTRRPTVAEALVAALDDWAAVRLEQRNDASGANRLLVAARAADPDPWRERLHVAQEQRGGKERLHALRQLASAAKTDELPAVSLDLLGVALFVDGDAEGAADVLRKAQRSHPRDAWLKYNLARCLEKLGRKEEAIRYLMAARTIRPESAHGLAHLLEQKGESDEAAAIFQDLVRLRPDQANHWACYGHLLTDLGEETRAANANAKAIPILRKTIERNPGDDGAHYTLGNILLRQGKPDEAIAEWKQVIRLNPKHVGAHLNLGVTLRDRGKNEEGIAETREALRLKPDDARAHNNLGNVLCDQGKKGEGIAEIREAIRLTPDNSLFRLNLGMTLESQGKFDEAVAEFKEAIRLKPDYYEAHKSLGLDLFHQGKFKEAIAEFKEAIRLKPNGAEAHNILGVTLNAQGKLAEAISEYEEALRFNPNFFEAHFNLGVALENLGRLTEAIAEYKAALRINPNDVTSHLNLGVALRAQGKSHEAIAEWRQVLKLDPEHGPAHYNLGTIYLMQGRRDEALAELREAVRLSPDHAEIHTNFGVALSSQGKLEEAIAEYRKAVELKPDLAEAHKGYARVLRDQAKLEGAVAEFKVAARINPGDASTHHELGHALWELKKLEPAIAEFREAKRIKTDYAEAHKDLGDILLEQEKLLDAILEYRMAVRISPRNADFHNRLGNALRSRRDLEEAIAEYKIAIGIDPKQSIFFNNLGNALCDKGMLNEAIAEYKTAIRINPENSGPHYSLAVALSRWRKPEEAIIEYREAIRLKPEFAMAHNNLGCVLKDQGDLAKAMAEYHEAIRHNPALAMAHANLAVALGLQGKPKEAMAEYRETIRLDPNFAQAHNNLAWALVISPKRPRSEYDEGLVHARKAVVHAKNGENCYGTLALAEYRSGHWAESLAASKRTMELRKGMFAYDWFFQALAHGQKGNKAEARKWFDKAIAWTKEKDPKNAELRQFWAEAAGLLGQPGPEAPHAP